MQQTFGAPFYTAQALSHTASQGQLVGYGGTPLSPDQSKPPPIDQAQLEQSVFPNDERAQQLHAPKIRNENFPHGSSTDDQEAASSGANISSYDDPPLSN